MIAAQQARAFLMMVCCGAVCACMHDAARLLGWLLGGRQVFIALMDLLWGVVLAVGMTCAGLNLGINPLRLYLFAGVGIGAAFWYMTGGLLGRKAGQHLCNWRTIGQKSDQ